MSTRKPEEKSVSINESDHAFSNCRVVVKIGGSALATAENIETIVDQLVVLFEQGCELTVIHGGGPHISRSLQEQGITPCFVDGLRVTDDTTLMLAFSALGHINSTIVSALLSKGVPARGLHAEPNLFTCKKKSVRSATGDKVDLGWVGEIISTDVSSVLHYAGSVCVISPIGWDGNRNRYNVNADHAVLAVAKSLQADTLFFLSDVSGVLTSSGDPSSRLPSLRSEKIHELIRSGSVSGGMIPKLLSSLQALEDGVGRVCIVDGKEDWSLIRALASPGLVGTTILRTNPETSPRRAGSRDPSSVECFKSILTNRVGLADFRKIAGGAREQSLPPAASPPDQSAGGSRAAPT